MSRAEWPGARHRALILAAIAVAATLERLWFRQAWGQSESLTNAFYYGDATRFIDYATAIAAGRSYDNGIPYHPPGWPLVLAGLIKLAGGRVPAHAITWLLAAASGLSVAIAAALAGEVAGVGALLAVGVIGTFHFGHLVEATVAGSEAAYGLLVIGTVLMAWRWLHDAGGARTLWATAAGAMGGGAMLVRAEWLAAAVLFGMLALRRRRAIHEIAAYAAAFAIMLLPTTVWHWRTLTTFNAAHVGRVAGPLPRFVPVTSYGPFNFAMANHASADGGPNRDHPMLELCSGEEERDLAGGQLDLACPAIYDLYVNGYAIGARWILVHPVDALVLMGTKISYTVGFLAHGYLVDNVGASLAGSRRRVDVLDPDARWLVAVHLVLCVGGILALRRQPPALAVMTVPLAAFAASVLLFYGYVRLGLAYLPLIWVMQAAAIASVLAGSAGRPATRHTVAAVLIGIAVVLGYDGARRMGSTRVTAQGPRLPNGALIEDETLRLYDRGERRPGR